MKKIAKVIAMLTALTVTCTACGLSGAPAASSGSDAPTPASSAADSNSKSEVKVGLERNVYSIPNNSSAGSGVRVLRLSVSMNEADYGVSATGAMVKTFVDRMEELSGGKILVQVYPGNQLAGTTDDIVNGMNTGAFEMSETATGNWGDYTTAYAPMNVPFLFETDEAAYNVMIGELGQKMNDQLLADTGMHAVGFMYLGLRTVTNNKKEIHTPADLKGLKIRVQSDPIQLATFEALGASTMTVSFSELFTALQQGLCDAQDNPVSSIVSKKFYEVQKYLTLLNHNANISIFYMSDPCWSQLTDEERGWVMQAGKDATKASYDACISANVTLVQQLKDYGIVVTELNPEEHQQFVDAVSDGVWAQCKSVMGEDMWNAMLAASTEASK